MVVFDRPLGAPADVKELEYVSALHQTSPVVRTDGSVQAVDIQIYLKSRFGIEVALDVVTNTILQGMGGSADDGEVVDLMEMTAILLIPYLVKCAAVQGGQALPVDVLSPSPHVLRYVTQMILHDVSHQNDDEEDLAAHDHESHQNGTTPLFDMDAPPALTASLVQRILRAYGEDDLADDEALVQQMLEQATTTTATTTTSSISDGNGMGLDDNDGHGDDGRGVLDAAAMARALTNDLQLYDTANEVRAADVYQDIFGKAATAAAVGEQQQQHRTGKNGEKALTEIPDAPELKKIYTASAIDSTAGTYRSKALMICLWAGTLFSYFTIYLTQGNGFAESQCDPYIIGGNWSENGGTMACKTIDSIIFWLFTFIYFCLFGMIWVGCGSCGNTKVDEKCWKDCCSVTFLLVFVVFVFVLFNDEDYNAGIQYIRVVGLILGCIVTFIHCTHCFTYCKKEDTPLKLRLIRNSNKAEVDLKSAISFKTNRMVNNAIEIHHSTDKQNIVKTCFGHALHVFSKWNKTEKVGGLFWSWREISSGRIFKQEGIWYSVRLLAANVSQYIVVLFIFLIGIVLLQSISDNFNSDATKETLRNTVDNVVFTEVNYKRVENLTHIVGEYVSEFVALLNQTQVVNIDCSPYDGVGFEVFDFLCENSGLIDFNSSISCGQATSAVQQAQALCAYYNIENLNLDEELTLLGGAGFKLLDVYGYIEKASHQVIEDSVDSLYPNNEYMLVAPFIVAIIVAVLTSTFLAVSYLPSITATTLQLRTGVIPTLCDQQMNKFRAAPDTVTLLTGSLFWGCLFSGVLVGALVGAAVFLLVWQGSIYYMQQLVAIIVGITVIALIRFMIMMYGRARYFKSLYRTRPASANIFFLAMEWANFALSAGFVFVRLIKLLLIAGLSVGRIDTPFLAKGVGVIGPVELDPFPTVHMRDIMSHEAHRHPYMETLGSIYLMKLRYGKLFCNNAGSCWRLIFVYALMPWMQKYRIFDSDNDNKKMLDEDGNEILDEAQVSTQLRQLDRAREEIMTTVEGNFEAAPAILSSLRKSSSKSLMVRSLRAENEKLQATIKALEEQLLLAKNT